MSVNINDIKVSPDEFREYTGIDLDKRLADDDSPSGKAERFIYVRQTRLNAWLNAQLHRNAEAEYTKGLSDFQKEHYKLAVIEYCKYIFKNGEIGERSGIDDDGKRVSSAQEINSAFMNVYTKNELIMSGLYSTHINYNGVIGPGDLL